MSVQTKYRTIIFGLLVFTTLILVSKEKWSVSDIGDFLSFHSYDQVKWEGFEFFESPGNFLEYPNVGRLGSDREPVAL